MPVGVAVGVVVGVPVGVGVGVGVEVPPPSQSTPLSLNAVGTGLAPLYEPLKPKEVEPPVASVPLYETFRAVTVAPDWLAVVFQAWVTCWLPAKVHSRVQELSGSPVLVTETLAPKPVPHWLETW